MRHRLKRTGAGGLEMWTELLDSCDNIPAWRPSA